MTDWLISVETASEVVNLFHRDDGLYELTAGPLHNQNTRGIVMDEDALREIIEAAKLAMGDCT